MIALVQILGVVMGNANMIDDMESDFLTADEQGQGSHWILTVSVLLILFLVGLFVADRIFHPEKFQIKQIEVRGQFHEVESGEVRRVVENALSGNYFTVSLDHLEKEIKQLAWVFSASLRRKWPSTIVVDVQEVQPVARWGESQWMNFTGDLVNREANISKSVSDKLPLLFGPSSESNEVWRAFSQWSEKFAVNGLNLDELSLDQRGIWKLQLSLSALSLSNFAVVVDDNLESPNDVSADISNVRVLMIVDKAEAHERIERFIRTLDQQLLEKFAAMQSIDLRYPNGFAISWNQQSPQSPLLSQAASEAILEINIGTQQSVID